MLSVKDPVETIEPVAAADAKTPAEELADRFLAERAVSVVADRAPEERRWVEIKCGRIGLDPRGFEKPEK